MEARSDKKFERPKGNYNREKKNGGTFTHFFSLPLISSESKDLIHNFQQNIKSKASENEDLKDIKLKFSGTNSFHITLCMLTLNTDLKKEKSIEIMKKNKDYLQSIFSYSPMKITLGKIETFGRGRNGNSVVFINIEDEEFLDKATKITDKLIRELMENEILHDTELKSANLFYDHRTNRFRPEKFHLTILRTEGDPKKLVESCKDITGGVHFIHTIDISTRFQYSEDGFYTPLIRIPCKDSSL